MGLKCPSCGNENGFQVKTIQMHVVQVNGEDIDLAEEETREAEVIREFLPRPLSDDEMRAAIAAAIAETRASSLRDMGAVMTKLKRRYPGRMDVCKCGAEVRSALA